MKLIVGLGNPEKKYEHTRHNLGFMVLDRIQSKGISGQPITPFRLENQFKTEITQTGGVGENRVIFAKPHTYMNNSGESVEKILSYYKIGHDDLLVVSDDIDLDFGVIRIRAEGASGGHKGLKSIIEKIGDSRFLRIRVGIGSDKNIPSEKYVLEKFTPKEEKILPQIIDKSADLVLKWIKSGEIKEETVKI